MTATPIRALVLTCGCAAALALAAPHAKAQSNEFRLDQSGNLVQTRPVAPPGTDEGQVGEARRALAEDRPEEAKALLDDFIDRNERTQNPLLGLAFQLRGDAWTALGDEYEALYDYERVIKEFPATESFVTANERELDIAVRYANGLRRKFFGVRVVDATDIAEELLIRVQERLPGSRLAERAGIELADYYYRERDLALAVQAYDLFIKNYPRSQYLQKAMQRRIYATIGRFKGPKYDGSSLVDAKILTRRYASMFPQAAQEAGLDEGLITRLDESAAQELMETANYYFRRDDDISAKFVLKRLVRTHPRSQAAAQALETMKERGWGPVEAAPTTTEPAGSSLFKRVDEEGRAAEANAETPEAADIEKKAQEAAEKAKAEGSTSRPPPVEPRAQPNAPTPTPTPTPATEPKP